MLRSVTTREKVATNRIYCGVFFRKGRMWKNNKHESESVNMLHFVLIYSYIGQGNCVAPNYGHKRCNKYKIWKDDNAAQF